MPSPLFRRLATLLGILIAHGATQAQAAPPDCQPQTQVDVKTITQQIVLIGEVHGTREIPAFVSGLVCSLLRDGRSVILAIERDGSEQEGLNRYLLSDGNGADREALLQGERWKSAYPDGRASQAMLALVEDMRRLRQAGQRVGVLAMQTQGGLNVPMDATDWLPLNRADSILHGQLNDQGMANSVLKAATLYRRYTLVVLAGTAHTTTLPGQQRDKEHRAMGYLVAQQEPCFRIGISTGGGMSLSSGPPNGYGERPVEAGKLLASDDTPVDVTVQLPRVSSSPAARPPEPRPAPEGG